MQSYVASVGGNPQGSWDDLSPEQRGRIEQMLTDKYTSAIRNVRSLMQARGQAHGVGQPGWTPYQMRYFNGATKSLFQQFQDNEAKIRSLGSIMTQGTEAQKQDQIKDLQAKQVILGQQIEQAREDTNRMGHTSVPGHTVLFFGPRGQYSLESSDPKFAEKKAQFEAHGYKEVPPSR